MSGHAKLQSAMLMLAQMAAKGFAPPKLGEVTSYDPDAYSVKVMLQPEETETGWLPILTSMAGVGWGVYAGPAIGDQALVVFHEGDVTSGICLGFLPSEIDTPPHVETGEIHLIAKDAEASIILKPDGSITSMGQWTHTGTLHVTDDVTMDADLSVAGDGAVDGDITAGGDVSADGGTVNAKTAFKRNGTTLNVP